VGSVQHNIRMMWKLSVA